MACWVHVCVSICLSIYSLTVHVYCDFMFQLTYTFLAPVVLWFSAVVTCSHKLRRQVSTKCLEGLQHHLILFYCQIKKKILGRSHKRPLHLKAPGLNFSPSASLMDTKLLPSLWQVPWTKLGPDNIQQIAAFSPGAALQTFHVLGKTPAMLCVPL